MRHRRLGEVDALDQRGDHLARLRSLDGDHRPLLGGRGQPHLEIGEFGLEIVLHVMEDARRPAGRGGDVEAVGGDPADHAVIHDEARLAQHQPVAAASGLELRPGVGVEAVHELGRVRPDHLDLAERRGVEDADRAPHRAAFAGDRLVHVLAVLREIARPFPQADVLEDRAVLDRPVVDRRLADGIEQVAAREPGERAEGHRRVRIAERRQADGRDRSLPARRRRSRGR